MPSFEPLLYQCRKCKDFLQSKYQGQYVSCQCGNAVDQTAYYTRLIGNFEDLEIIDNEG